MDERTDTTIGVLIVDDHQMYGDLAAEVVHATTGFAVVDIALDRATALRCVRDRRDDVDVVLMDVNLGDDDGLKVAREMVSVSPQLHVVLVTTLRIDDMPQAARSCGARGYLPKEELSPATLMQVLDGVYDWSDGQSAGSSS